jgi:hypothetical protein
MRLSFGCIVPFSFLFALLCVFQANSASAESISPLTYTYTFSLNCTDCTNPNVTATIVSAVSLVGSGNSGDESPKEQVTFEYGGLQIEYTETSANLTGYVNSTPGDYSIQIDGVTADGIPYDFIASGIGSGSSFGVYQPTIPGCVSNYCSLTNDDQGTVNSFTGPGINATPEPSGLVLLTTGVAALAGLRRRMKR